MGSGVPDNLTITALDEFQNVATSYGAGGGETKNLTFEGAGVAPSGSEATVANESGTATKFAQPTAIRFVAGKASVSGTANGVMTLYKVEEAHIKVKEGTLNNGTGLAIKVIAGPAKSFRLAAPAPAEPEAGQAFNVTHHRARRRRQHRHELRRRGRAEQDARLLGPGLLALRQGARIPRLGDHRELPRRRRHGDARSSSTTPAPTRSRRRKGRSKGRWRST